MEHTHICVRLRLREVDGLGLLRVRPCVRVFVRASASSSAHLLHAFSPAFVCVRACSSGSVHARLRPCLCACVSVRPRSFACFKNLRDVLYLLSYTLSDILYMYMYSMYKVQRIYTCTFVHVHTIYCIVGIIDRGLYLANRRFCFDTAKIKPTKCVRVICRMALFHSNCQIYSCQMPAIRQIFLPYGIIPVEHILYMYCLPVEQ